MDVERLGLPVPKRLLPVVLAGGALLLFLLFTRRGGSNGSSATPPTLAEEAEFARAVSSARADLAGVQSSAEAQRQLAFSLFANSPAGLRECWTADEWRALPADVRRSIKSQAHRSGTLLTAGNDGAFCLLPTAAGLSGNLQSVQRSRGGLFGGSSSGVGTAAPPVPRAGLLDAFDAYLASQRGGY